MTTVVRANRGLYKIMLLLYPRDFRMRFANEMVTTFSDQMCGEWEHSGLSGVARVWCLALWEVLSAAAPLQLKNSIVIATSLALLSSLVLFMAIFHAMTHVCGE